MIITNLLLVALLIALTAFFVASEFAIVKVRMSRINQLVAEGNKQAMAAQKVITNIDEYLSACQLGITLTSLGLGWLGEPTVERLLHPLFERFGVAAGLSNILSFVIAFSVITFLHVVVGELAPKTLAIQKAERLTLLLSKPLILFYRVMYPFIWALNGSARLFTGLFGLKPASEHEAAHSEEELRIILSESYAKGEINQSEYKYVDRIFEFDERIAKEIMVPRTDMMTLSQDTPWEEMKEVLKNVKYTRYPVDDGDKDNIIGMVNIKEILAYYLNDEKYGPRPLQQFIKPTIRVIETIPIHDLLLKMQKERIHMAILLDEYGGTSGLVTVEDILEEIVGEIRDEFDTDEKPEVQRLGENHYLLSARVLITEVNDLLGTDLSDEEVDTIGGWFLTQQIDVELNDMIEHEGYQFIIRDVDGHHIHSIEVVRSKQIEEEEIKKD
ncbi:CBS domain containing-hemolysin-like protein [Bacillus ectoiniformans]|uniref:hemolysin family protein n=1 Tax=Bacillus ectoiniformans TaxID=1494429 RepID=UPI0019585C64|nr:hemolysin family protein [Bacillus ectoiniformans]MBM7649588.1 CBS domain containing-hemolysin-like protein [Bacillus ectoiniformans]